MSYRYDNWGWYDGEVAAGSPRSTDIAPPTLSQTTVVGEDRANWTGRDWVVLQYREPPPAGPAPAALRRITKFAFRNRFNQTEKEDIELAMLDRPTGQPAERRAAARLRAYDRDIAVATFIDLERPDTRNGVLGLEAAGLIAAGRALEILDAPIQPDEMYEE